jgi:hypothetical protein
MIKVSCSFHDIERTGPVSGHGTSGAAVCADEFAASKDSARRFSRVSTRPLFGQRRIIN